MISIGWRIRQMIAFQCPHFPIQITKIIQNGHLVIFSMRFVYQLIMVLLGVFTSKSYPYYRIFESISMLLCSIASKVFISYKPKHGYLFTGGVGIAMFFIFFETMISYYGGEIGLLFFNIYNATNLTLLDFLKYYWIIIGFEAAVTMYAYARSFSTLLYPGSFTLQNMIFYGLLSIIVYGFLFYLFIVSFHIMFEETKKKTKAIINWKTMMEKLPLGIIFANKNEVLFSNTYSNNLLTSLSLEATVQSIHRLLNDFDVINTTKQSKTINVHGKCIFCDKQEIEYDDISAIAYTLNDLSYLFEAQQHKEEQHALEMFVATSTHELRTPLHIIKNTLELMLDDPKNGQCEFISKSLNACEMQECYINDILDYAKMKAGKLNLIIEPYNLRDILYEIHGYFVTMATEAQLSFEVYCKDEKLIAAIDYIRMKQIMFNLISNALKFTIKGGIKLKAYATESKVVIEVQDSGIGMTNEELDNLFKAFGMIESTRSLNKSGTGLGLFLCKALSLLMNSSINVQSTKNDGTTFSIAFTKLLDSTPYSIRNMKKQSKYGKDGKNIVKISYKILIVDDNNFNCQILERMLSSLGIHSYKALNGEKALEYIKEHDDIKLALLDLHMPIMDGFELLKLIQEYYKSLGTEVIQVFALTGDSTEDVRRKCNDAGFNGFLSKPFSRDSIIDIIRGLKL